VLSSVAVVLPLALLFQASDTSDGPRRVGIEGVDEKYASCAIVTPTIRNNGTRSLYMEVYVEVNRDGEDWSYECPTYDLTDPRSEHIKRIIINPRMTDTGLSLTVPYDRCAGRTRCEAATRPVTDAQVRREIIRADTDARPPISERFRVDLYELVDGHVERVGREYSRAFTRSGHAVPAP
jgi:hypothetical protein